MCVLLGQPQPSPLTPCTPLPFLAAVSSVSLLPPGRVYIPLARSVYFLSPIMEILLTVHRTVPDTRYVLNEHLLS